MLIMLHPTTRRILRAPSGKIAGSAACCCVASCCLDLPAELFADITWCGTNTITLTRYFGYDCSSCIFWRGTGRFGGVGNNDVIVEVKCCGNPGEVEWRYDACAGFVPGTECELGPGSGQWHSTSLCDPFPINFGPEAPPGSCGSCVETFNLVIRK